MVGVMHCRFLHLWVQNAIEKGSALVKCYHDTLDLESIYFLHFLKSTQVNRSLGK